MKDMRKLTNECIEQLHTLGISHGMIIFKINTRAKKRWGQCKAINDDCYEINISSRLLEDKLDDMAAKNTIMHELLHAADGCKSGHSGNWLRLANKVMKAYPQYDIKRCSSAEEKGLEPDDTPVRRLKYSYFFRCLGCGAEVKYKRAAKFTREPLNYVCVRCRGKFVSAEEYERLTEEERRALNEKLKKED